MAAQPDERHTRGPAMTGRILSDLDGSIDLPAGKVRSTVILEGNLRNPSKDSCANSNNSAAKYGRLVYRCSVPSNHWRAIAGSGAGFAASQVIRSPASSRVMYYSARERKTKQASGRYIDRISTANLCQIKVHWTPFGNKFISIHINRFTRSFYRQMPLALLFSWTSSLPVSTREG